MTDLQGKLQSAATEIAAKRGPLDLLAAFYRDDVPPMWDLIVSARGLHADNHADLNYVVGVLRKAIGADNLVTVSRVIVLEYRGAVAHALLDSLDGRIGPVELPEIFAQSKVRGVVVSNGGELRQLFAAASLGQTRSIERIVSIGRNKHCLGPSERAGVARHISASGKCILEKVQQLKQITH